MPTDLDYLLYERCVRAVRLHGAGKAVDYDEVDKLVTTHYREMHRSYRDDVVPSPRVLEI